jgi:hypothetical protein
MQLIHLLIDARRLDGKDVLIKKSRTFVNPYEGDIGRLLSSSELVKDTRNHSVPIYNILSWPHEPDLDMIVMPFLRPMDDPPFDTIGEVRDYLRKKISFWVVPNLRQSIRMAPRRPNHSIWPWSFLVFQRVQVLVTDIHMVHVRGMDNTTLSARAHRAPGWAAPPGA